MTHDDYDRFDAAYDAACDAAPEPGPRSPLCVGCGRPADWQIVGQAHELFCSACRAQGDLEDAQAGITPPEYVAIDDDAAVTREAPTPSDAELVAEFERGRAA